jgi:phage shock protein PspC (stress-responsive transcriptional regulator)
MVDKTKYLFLGVIYRLCLKYNITDEWDIFWVRMLTIAFTGFGPMFLLLYIVFYYILENEKE